MIQGDIDLTTNLDFYHDKPEKELPAIIPWNNPDKEDKVTFHSTLLNSSTSRNRRSYAIGNYELWTDYGYNTIRYNNEPVYSYSIPDMMLERYIVNSNTLMEVYANEDESSWTYLNSRGDTVAIEYNNDNTITLTYKYPIKKKDITKELFGYSARPEDDKEMNTCFFRCYRCKTKHIGKKCDCEKYESNKYYQCKKKLSINKPIDESKYYYCKNKIFLNNLTTDYSRRRGFRFSIHGANKDKIPWLSKLPDRIYHDYIEDLNEEKDYTSYLTDMDWLGIH